MERAALRRSVDQARLRLAGVRGQLREIGEELRATGEAVARDGPAAPGAAFDAAAELDAVLGPGAEAAEAAGDRRDAEAETDEDLVNARLRATLGPKGDGEALAVCRSLHSLQAIRARPFATKNRLEEARILAEQRGDRHPYRVIVFSGAQASLQCAFNVDEEATFGALLQHVCLFWKLDAASFALEANASADSGYYTPLAFSEQDRVLERLEHLKYDSSRGMGRNGIKVSVFATDVLTLPPLYLIPRLAGENGVSLTSSRGGLGGVGLNVMSRDDARSMAAEGVRLQILRRLYEDVDPQYRFVVPGNDESSGYVTFEGFQPIVHAYFEGFFFDRASLSALFERESEIIRVARRLEAAESSSSRKALTRATSQERLHVQVPSAHGALATAPLLGRNTAADSGSDDDEDEDDDDDDEDEYYESSDSDDVGDDGGEEDQESGMLRRGHLSRSGRPRQKFLIFEVIDFDACVRIIRALGTGDDDPMRALAKTLLGRSEPSFADMNDEIANRVSNERTAVSGGAAPDARRVFAWMLAGTPMTPVGAGPSARTVPVSVPPPRDGRLDLQTFQRALQRAIRLDVEILRQWWTSSFDCLPEERISEQEFNTGWTVLRARPVPNVEPASASTRTTTAGELVRRAMVADEVANARLPSPAVWSSDRSLERTRTVIDLVCGLVSLALAYAVIFTTIQPYLLSEIARQYQRQLLGTDIHCLTVDETGITEESIPTAFSEVARPGCVWGFVDGPLFDLYFAQASRASKLESNQRADPAEDQTQVPYWKTLMYNRVVPELVTVRQLAVNQTLCSRSPNFPGLSYFVDNNCYGAYSAANRRESPLELNLTRLPSGTDPGPYERALEWQDADAYDFDTFDGRFATYDGSGYVFELGKLDENTPADASLEEKVAAAQAFWRDAVQNLFRIGWVQTGMRAIIINVGLVNPNVNLYTNLQIVFEVADAAVVGSTMAFLSFDVKAESARLASTVLRWLLFFLTLGTFIAQTVLTQRYNFFVAGDAGPQAAGGKAGTLVRAQDSDDVPDDRSESPQSIFVTSAQRAVVAAWQTVSRSASLTLQAFLIVWLGVTIGVANVFVLDDSRKSFAQELPTKAWNGFDMWQEYVRVAHLDCVTLILVTCRAMAGLKIFKRTALVLEVAKSAAPSLALFALVLYLLMCVFTAFVLTTELNVVRAFLDFRATLVLALSSANHYGLHALLYESGNPEIPVSTFFAVLGFDMLVLLLLGTSTAILYYHYVFHTRLAASSSSPAGLGPRPEAPWRQLALHLSACTGACYAKRSLASAIDDPNDIRLASRPSDSSHDQTDDEEPQDDEEKMDQLGVAPAFSHPLGSAEAPRQTSIELSSASVQAAAGMPRLSSIELAPLRRNEPTP